MASYSYKSAIALKLNPLVMEGSEWAKIRNINTSHRHENSVSCVRRRYEYQRKLKLEQYQQVTTQIGICSSLVSLCCQLKTACMLYHRLFDCRMLRNAISHVYKLE